MISSTRELCTSSVDTWSRVSDSFYRADLGCIKGSTPSLSLVLVRNTATSFPLSALQKYPRTFTDYAIIEAGMNLVTKAHFHPYGIQLRFRTLSSTSTLEEWVASFENQKHQWYKCSTQVSY